jgi:hypothetical protein
MMAAKFVMAQLVSKVPLKREFTSHPTNQPRFSQMVPLVKFALPGQKKHLLGSVGRADTWGAEKLVPCCLCVLGRLSGKSQENGREGLARLDDTASNGKLAPILHPWRGKIGWVGLINFRQY